MPTKEENIQKLYPIKTYSKKELSDMYGITGKTFRSWCINAGLDFGRSNILTPRQVRMVFDEFDPPYGENNY